MGHSEMGLAVAGLKEDEIARLARRLSGGDWADFPPAERLALQFAYKLTHKPASVSQADLQGLVGAFGRHRAVDLIWRTAWCNYMTRVADAFQFPLERENVFAPPKTDGGKGTSPQR
jgi:alkylhydroperoxidase family enzyme